MTTRIVNKDDIFEDIDSELHRDDDLPAYIGSQGGQLYCFYGVGHRTFGPALLEFEYGVHVEFHCLGKRIQDE